MSSTWFDSVPRLQLLCHRSGLMRESPVGTLYLLNRAFGIKRMYGPVPEDRFYYLTLYNENYEMPDMPEGVAEGIVRGLYRFAPAPEGTAVTIVHSHWQRLGQRERNERGWGGLLPHYVAACTPGPQATAGVRPGGR